ncbi:unnamed protein product [Rhizophagus irregularis]|nr:unnamed protein product [Rhizophagus irregularis]
MCSNTTKMSFCKSYININRPVSQYGQNTSGTPKQRTAYMAPRPGYDIPLGDISPMAKLTTLFIRGISPRVTDDWKKFSR